MIGKERPPDYSAVAERELAVRSFVVQGYWLILVVNLSLFAGLTSIPANTLNIAYLAVSLATAVTILVVVFRRSLPLINPLTLYVTIWLILVPLTSMDAPLMPAMSLEQIRTCLIGGSVYAAGGLIVGILVQPGSAATISLPRTPIQISPRLMRLAQALLVVSIIAMLGNMALSGDVALFSELAESRKAKAVFLGYPLLSSLGTISLVVGALSIKVTWTHRASAGLYLVLQLLSGQRFVAIVGILLVVATVGSLGELSRMRVRRVATLLLALVGAFLLVAQFRGGAADHNLYFVETGIYNGDPQELNATEILRYVGMSQRNMTQVMDRTFDGTHALEFTLSPILWVLGFGVSSGLGTSTFGYTANNALAYLYHDAGPLWPLLGAFWAIVINIVYWVMRERPHSLTWRFCWSVAALGLSLSFFGYVNAYVYWVVLFPVVVAILEKIGDSPSGYSAPLRERISRGRASALSGG
jgi:hypothetical protein